MWLDRRMNVIVSVSFSLIGILLWTAPPQMSTAMHLFRAYLIGCVKVSYIIKMFHYPEACNIFSARKKSL